MKDHHFTKELLSSLFCLLIVIAVCDAGFALTKQVPSAKQINVQNKDKLAFQDPIEYVLEKFEHYDLVMIGERHWTREEPVFIQNLIKCCYKKNTIDAVFLEFISFDDQGKISTFLEAAEYDPEPVIEALRNETVFGWGYQEYFEIFKLIYNENSKRPPSKRVRLVMVDRSLEGVDLYSYLHDKIKQMKVPREKIFSLTGSLRDALFDRDRFMSDVIEMYRYEMNVVKGIYYAGSSHIRKDLQKKDYGRRYFSAGGILARRYPGRVCCLTFHQQPQYWQDPNDFRFIEQLYKSYGKPFAIDTNDPKIRHLKLKSDVIKEGVALKQAFDGYIMLNLDNDYHPSAFIPGFYDDEFAEVIWHKLRDQGALKRFPAELQKWQQKPWTGEELMELMKQGLH